MRVAEGSVVHLPAREIPPPSTISDQARATLSGSPLSAVLFSEPEPSPNDKAAWRRFVARRDELGTPMLAPLADLFPCDIVERQLDAARLYELTPQGSRRSTEAPIILFLHGGGYTSAAGRAGAYLALRLAHKLRISTFSLDYRMPPDHPFPAAVDDGIAAYRFLLQSRAPQDILVAGRSAGGGLAASLVLRARDLGLPMPAACILQTPMVDLTESGDIGLAFAGVDGSPSPLAGAELTQESITAE